MWRVAGLGLLCVGCFAEPTGTGEPTSQGDTGTGTTTTSPATSDSSGSSTAQDGSTTGGTFSGSSGSTTGSADSGSTTGNADSGSTSGGEAQWEPSLAWITRFDSAIEANGDRVDEVIAAQDGTLWVAGAFGQMPSRLFLAQLEVDGSVAGSYTFPSSSISNARGLAETSTGLIVGGHGNSVEGGTDRLLVEFDPVTEAFGEPYAFEVQEGLDIVESVVAGTGDVRFVAGVVQAGGEQRAWVERLPSAGPVWSLEAGAGATGNRANDLYRLGPADNFELIVTGALRTSVDAVDTAWVARYSINGVERWTTMLPSDDGYPTVARAATEGISSSVLAVGSINVPGEGSNAWVQQLQSSGRTGWSWNFDGGFSANDDALDVASDAEGDVFVCGSSVGATTGADLWVARLDRNGVPQGQFFADLGESEDDVISSCVVVDDQLIIAGRGTTNRSVRRDGFVAALPL